MSRRPGTKHDAMARCRKRLRSLLNEREYLKNTTKTGRLLQKRLADYMEKSEPWLANLLAGKRGLRLVDLDKLAEFFRLPVSEFVREDENYMMELTPTERRLIRHLRRMPTAYRDHLLSVAKLLPVTTEEDDDTPPKNIKKPKEPDDDST